MNDKAIEIADKVLLAAMENDHERFSCRAEIIANIIRPYLAPEYKYAQVPCSEHIKLKPRKPYGAIGISVGEAKK
jgi:hypothetical protein